MVKIVQSMFSNEQSRDRVDGTFRNDFLVVVGLHQDSVLSPLLFVRLHKKWRNHFLRNIIVLEALSREVGSGWPEKLLYVNDLALVNKTRSKREARSLEGSIGGKRFVTKCKEDKNDDW